MGREWLKKSKVKNNIKTPSESSECVSFAQYLRLLENQGKILKFTKTAQETYTRSWKQKSKNKREGVNPGLPDYIIVTKNEVVFIEMKKADMTNHLSDSQKEWFEALKKIKANVHLCYGFDDAKIIIHRYV